jgi:glyoxylase-like metal-dependent hydrolase (beta-lactamase superfamily II)
MPVNAWSIMGNQQRLDGGAMFGNAPKALWVRWIEPDSENRIPLACRALLIREESGRTILFEAGIGMFFSPKLRSRFGVFEDRHVLLDSLAEVGFSPADIDVIVLSHLHFDHAGGLLTEWNADSSYRLCFPDANYVVGRDAWARALAPHSRDRASFIPELQPLLKATGRLEIVDGDRSETLGAAYRLHYSDGHTPGLMLAEIPSADGPIVFCGDLIPGVPWVHLPITMGYDRFPEQLIDEKQSLLGELIDRGGRLFFTHDPDTAMGRLTQDERGRYGVTDTLTHLDTLEL